MVPIIKCSNENVSQSMKNKYFQDNLYQCLRTCRVSVGSTRLDNGYMSFITSLYRIPNRLLYKIIVKDIGHNTCAYSIYTTLCYMYINRKYNIIYKSVYLSHYIGTCTCTTLHLAGCTYTN